MTRPADAPALPAALAILGVLAASVWAGTAWIATVWVVAGESMVPTLGPGDRVLVDVWSYRFRDPRPGEVALVVEPGGPPGPLVKRVAAVRRGEGAGFRVLGDNRAASRDSRHFGPLPRSAFRGRVVLRLSSAPDRAGG